MYSRFEIQTEVITSQIYNNSKYGKKKCKIITNKSVQNIDNKNNWYKKQYNDQKTINFTVF